MYNNYNIDTRENSSNIDLENTIKNIIESSFQNTFEMMFDKMFKKYSENFNDALYKENMNGGYTQSENNLFVVNKQELMTVIIIILVMIILYLLYKTSGLNESRRSYRSFY